MVAQNLPQFYSYICELLCENRPLGTFGILRNINLKH